MVEEIDFFSKLVILLIIKCEKNKNLKMHIKIKYKI